MFECILIAAAFVALCFVPELLALAGAAVIVAARTAAALLGACASSLRPGPPVR